MLFLNANDRLKFFPSVQLAGAMLDGAIQTAQTTAETIARRKFDVTRYIETVNISDSGRGQLAYVPIVASPSIQLKTMTGEPIERFDLDYESGELFVYRAYAQIRVIYHSGFVPDTPQSLPIKVSIASILNYQVLN